jgi:hypothetical protein
MPGRELRVRVPALPPGLGANLLGLAGLVGIAVAIGALTGSWWWSVLAGSVFAVGLSWLAGVAEPVPVEATNVRALPAAAKTA